MKSTKTPPLRFPEFQSDWEEMKLGELLSFKNGINATKEQYGQGYKFINVLDIINNDVITYDKIIGSVDISEKDFEKNEVKYGDILFQRSSETREEAGQANVYLDKNQTATFGGFVIRGRKEGDYVPEFLNYLLKTRNARKEITSKSGGSTRYNVGQETLKDVAITSTSLPEQEKIASFLTAVDKRIALLTKKKEQLEQYKKGVMQQLFSQQIRFTQANGTPFPDWEYPRAKDVFKSHSNKNHDGDLPILSASQELGMVLRDENGIQIQSSEKSVKSYKVVEVGDFVISLRSFQGGLEYSELHGICSPAYTILKPTRKIDNHFYRQYFKKEDFIERLSKTVVGIRDGKQISYDAFGGLKIPYPSLPEQQKIASFLSGIDARIATVTQQITQTQTWKQGLLQGMFV